MALASHNPTISGDKSRMDAQSCRVTCRRDLLGQLTIDSWDSLDSPRMSKLPTVAVGVSADPMRLQVKPDAPGQLGGGRLTSGETSVPTCTDRDHVT